MWTSCIYKINVGEQTYVGSTYDLKNRLRQHKSDCYNTESKKYNYKLYKHIRETCNWADVNVEVLVHLHPKFNKDERCIFEQEWIDYLKPTLNDYKAYQTEEQKYQSQKTRCKIYKENHKEQIKIQTKQYRIDNKDEIKEKQKQYLLENKDYKNARKREKIKCEHCDDIVTRNSMARHVRRKHN
tara:strand:- start:248 stop:799 length:552 start_codon:yes stop_codon:yes gene_type:complete